MRHGDLVSSLCEDLLVSLRNSLEIAEQMQQTDLKVQKNGPEVLSSALLNLRHTSPLYRPYRNNLAKSTDVVLVFLKTLTGGASILQLMNTVHVNMHLYYMDLIGQ